MNEPTDLQGLLKQGFDEDSCKKALSAARGDCALARHILNSAEAADGGKKGKQDISWTKEQEDDWVSNVSSNQQSVHGEIRALVKSPVYLRIAKWRKVYSDETNYRVFYTICVTMKDRRQWELEQPYSVFLSFNNSLPHRMCSQFASKFPGVFSMFMFALSDEQIEQRRMKLESWLHELSMTEACMSSPEVVALLYNFIGEVAHRSDKTTAGAAASTFASSNGAMSASSKSSPLLTVVTNSSSPVSPSPLGVVSPGASGAAPTPRKILVPERSLTSKSFPTTLQTLCSWIPCKFDANIMLQYNSVPAPEEARMSISHQQLLKDYKRDRVIVQGKRILGGGCTGNPDEITGYAQILQETIDCISRILPANSPDAFKFTPFLIQKFATMVLCVACRTNSAYLILLALTHMMTKIDEPLSDSSGGVGMRYMLVPESTLAKPIEISFSIVHRPTPTQPPTSGATSGAPPRPPSPTWCVKCDIIAASVFRISDPETLDTFAQIKATYYKTVFEFPIVEHMCPPEASAAFGPPEDVLVDNAKGITIMLEKESTTTSRDWTTA